MYIYELHIHILPTSFVHFFASMVVLTLALGLLETEIEFKDDFNGRNDEASFCYVMFLSMFLLSYGI